MPINILFVDDEDLILQSVKRVIRSKEIKIFLANSAKEGLYVLANNEIDIVVSDVKMPEMDGIEFLKEVRKYYPRVYRLILSGYVERDEILSAILHGVAFEYITKPWNKVSLKAKLDHIIEIKKKLNNDKIMKLINSISSLPKNMTVLRNVETSIDREDSLEEIASIIVGDLSITTKLLQIVNSSLYTDKKVSSVHQAIVTLGLDSLKELLFTSSFMENDSMSDWQKNKADKMMLRQLEINKLFASLYKEETENDLPDTYLSIGLIINIGKFIVLSYFPNRHLEIMEKMKSSQIAYYEAELELGFLGETHQEIGAYFLELWNFSKVNVEASLYHHNIEGASEEFREVLDILERASLMVSEVDSE